MITLGYTTNWTDRQGKIIISLWWKIVKKTGQNGCGGTVEKGVYNSMNLAMYSYGGQNPIKYVDPDGRNFGMPLITDGESYLNQQAGFKPASPEEQKAYEEMHTRNNFLFGIAIDAGGFFVPALKVTKLFAAGEIAEAVIPAIVAADSAAGAAISTAEAINHKEVNPVLKFFQGLIGAIFGGADANSVPETAAAIKGAADAIMSAPAAAEKVIPNNQNEECK
jgi:hypothetical protein